MYIQFLQSQLVSGLSHWQVIAMRPDRVILKIMDAQGRLAKTVMQWVQDGSQQLTIDLSDLLVGDYVVNAFNSDHFVKSFRMKKV